ncbi:MAG: MOSC domain-containing protein [Lysobacterales bacterium]
MSRTERGDLERCIGQVRAVLTGAARAYIRPGTRSAIAKTVAAVPLRVDRLGLQGDEQGDLRVHGGPAKAVHCYPWAHYPHWRDELPNCRLLDQPGAFGENFSIDPLVEDDVCIGDRWRIGTAVFEISQGRQPCWKLNDRFGIADMARRVQDSLRAGWYLRVLHPGVVRAGDAIVLLEQPYRDWTIARLLALIRDRSIDPTVLTEVLSLPLPDAWHRLFQARLTSGATESWSKRLEGLPPEQ